MHQAMIIQPDSNVAYVQSPSGEMIMVKKDVDDYVKNRMHANLNDVEDNSSSVSVIARHMSENGLEAWANSIAQREPLSGIPSEIIGVPALSPAETGSTVPDSPQIGGSDSPESPPPGAVDGIISEA